MVKIFWLRIITFILLWTYEIMNNSVFIPFSIILFAITLGLYFLVTVPGFLVWKYGASLTLIGVHGYFISGDLLMTVVLLLFIGLDASFRLERKRLIGLFLAIGLVMVAITMLEELRLEHWLLSAFVAFLSLKVNGMAEDRKEQREIYEELVGEYRMLKRLHLASENTARLEERTRIARDIHDSVGHRLTSLIMKLEMLDIQEENPAFKELKKMAKDSLEETRAAVKALQAEESEGIATVVHLIRKLEAESHLLVQFTLRQGVLSAPITNEMSVVLYRVIQEALTNIMRHGETRDAQIILSRNAANEILFEISNPLKKRKPFAMGFGLRNMQERVERVNGNLRVYQTNDRFIVSGKLAKGGD